MEKIKVGVVGVGYLGQFHAEKYAKTEGVELVGVVDIDASRAKEIARRHHTRPFFHHADLYDKVQAVSIVVPTPSHHAIAKDFFLHGIDILLEKPIAKTLGETDELITLAESRERILQVGHLERFNGAFVAAEGRVQDPTFIESHRLGPFSGREIDVDVVIDLMIHDIDILLCLVKADIRRMDAVGLSVLTPYADFANARIEFENGCVADLTASRISEEKIRRTRIFQPDGTLTIDYLTQRASWTKKAASSEKEERSEIVTEEIPATKVDALESEILSFVQSVRNRQQVRVSGRDGKRALEVAFQILAKIEENMKRRKGWHP